MLPDIFCDCVSILRRRGDQKREGRGNLFVFEPTVTSTWYWSYIVGICVALGLEAGRHTVDAPP